MFEILCFRRLLKKELRSFLCCKLSRPFRRVNTSNEIQFFVTCFFRRGLKKNPFVDERTLRRRDQIPSQKQIKAQNSNTSFRTKIFAQNAQTSKKNFSQNLKSVLRLLIKNQKTNYKTKITKIFVLVKKTGLFIIEAKLGKSFDTISVCS